MIYRWTFQIHFQNQNQFKIDKTEINISEKNVNNLFNPLSPDDASKHHFTSLKKYLMSLKPLAFGMTIFMELCDNNGIFFSLAIHYKSSSATTSREL